VGDQQAGAPGRNLLPLGILGALLVLGIGFWYFGIYDTAEGRCNRGDLGACFVLYAKQSAAASASAAAASVSAALVAASIQQSEAAVAASAQASIAGMPISCTVGPGDGSHNVRIAVRSSTAEQSICQQLVQSGWAASTEVDGATQVCQLPWSNADIITVTDTGGQLYGQQDCQSLRAGNLPSWGG
jgi:hypothetical protein